MEMNILSRKHILAPTYIVMVLLVVWTVSGGGPDIHRHPSASLAGLTGVDVSEIGPWVLNEDRKLEEVPGLSAALLQAANERFTGKPIAIGGTNGVRTKNPKLKLFLDYGTKSKLTLRGGRHLKSIKLALEDEARLERNPPVFMHITSWSCDRVQSAGETKKEQILGTFSLLLDEFISEYGREQARIYRHDEHRAGSSRTGTL